MMRSVRTRPAFFQIARARSWRRWLASVGLLVLIAGVLGSRTWAEAEDAEQSLRFRYVIDRSAVPEWVIHRDLTLRIDVHGAERVWAWGDGELLPAVHDTESGVLLVTTSATEIVIALSGQALAETAGDYAIAPLRDDKLWAYSLTFDDGEYTVYTHALPELQRFGYAAGVAVIGRWLERSDSVENGYCGVDEIAGLLAEGWGVYNHSYHHYDGLGNINLQEAQRCQDAIRDHLDGYEATVFTVPYTNQGWQPIIDTNGRDMGLQLMQLYADNGELITVVDEPVVLTDRPYHLGRRDVKLWIDGEYNVFDQAHDRAAGALPQRVWVSLHAHNIHYEEDWCGIVESTSYLYHRYGAGGSDEVWVAPVDQVYQYWVNRSYATVERFAETPIEPGATVVAPQTVHYRAGNGQSVWADTYIQEWYPTINYGRAHSMLARAGVSGRASPLFRITFTPPDDQAEVERAMLSFYLSDHTNTADLELTAYALLCPWEVSEATWQRPKAGETWGTWGARAVGEDYDPALSSAASTVHVRDCRSVQRWYTVDVTDAVARWVAAPKDNHGIILIAGDDVASGVYLYSSDHPDVAHRPVLQVTYRWPLPEPTEVPTIPPTLTPTASATATPTVTPTATSTSTPTPLGTHVSLPLILARAR